TKILFAQTQVCPVFRNFDAIAPSTAASKSASSKTIKGAFPPSSSDNFLIEPAHCAIKILPTSVEPVNESFRTARFEVSSAPISFSGPVTTLRTPFGTPARAPNSASASAEKGVCAAGLTTTVHPAANAGPIFRVIIASGKFQGVIQATTPTGCLMTTILLSFSG